MTNGALHEINRQDNIDLSVQINGINGFPANPQVLDNANNPDNCTNPIMIQMVDPGTGMAKWLASGIDLTTALNSALSTGTYAEKIIKGAIMAPLAVVFSAIPRVYGAIVDQFMSGIRGANQTIAVIANQEIFLNLINFICLGSLRKYKRLMQYYSDWQYPVGLPTPSEAGSAWLANTIDDCTFQTYVMASDTRFEPYKRVVQGGKFKFSALELMTLNKRQKLARSDINTRLRELGSLETTDVQELDSLFTQVPGPADLIRFMLRDIQNQQVVTTFDLSSGFTDNFNGQIQTWSTMQGLGQDVMLAEWMSHWSIPSPTQLYEMLHRLRHDPQFGGVDKVTSDVVTALKQQDILPYWIPKLMAVSYHPLTRTDLNHAYEHGWIDDDTYVNGMYANGYSDDDAKTLLKFEQNQQALAIRHSDFATAYAEGYIDTNTMYDWAEDEGYDASLFPNISNVADQKRKMNLWKRSIGAIAQQYKACRITKDEATKEALSIGIPQDVIDFQLGVALLGTTCGARREWQTTLCSLYTSGEMTASEYTDRMKVLKYDDTAIANYLLLCDNKKTAAQQKARQLLQKQQATAEQKAEKQAEMAAKQAAAQLNRTAKALAAAERSRQARNKALEDAAFLLGTYLSDVTDPPSLYVKGLYGMLTGEVGLSQNEAANLISSGSIRAKGMTSAQFSTWAMEAAQAGLATPWTLFPGATILANGE